MAFLGGLDADGVGFAVFGAGIPDVEVIIGGGVGIVDGDDRAGGSCAGG